MEKEIRNKEDIVKEIQWFKSGVSAIEEILNETNLKLDKLHDELVEVEKLEKKKVWKPKYKDEYYSIVKEGYVDEVTWLGDYEDDWSYFTNNCFKTEEEAERRKFELESEGKARLFQLENNGVIDWEDEGKEKFYIYYNIQSKVVGTYCFCSNKNANKLGYFSSRELARQFIEENKEDLIKYFEGLK